MPSKVAIARLVLALAVSLAAQTAAARTSDQVQVFSPDYFASAHPADAYDMVRRLPGFELIEGDDEVRGFSGSRGNILFDGRAPSGKEESLEEMLRGIPAANVLRVELIRGGAKGSATSGYDLVANIVRRKNSSLSSSAAVGAVASQGTGVRPNGRFELSRQSGERRLDAAMALENDVDDDSGKGSIVERDPTGAETGREGRDEREVQQTLSFNGEYKLQLGQGELVANAHAEREVTDERVRSQSDGGSSLATDHERLWSAEGGAQYKSKLGGGELEALFVHRMGWLNALAQAEDESFAEETRTSETIGRAEYRFGGGILHYFASAEAAFNRLDGDAKLAVGGAEVPIAGSDVDVSETRGEAAAGAIWGLSPSVVVEPSLRAELSTIRSTGDSPQSEHFLFWKPRLRVSWEHGGTRLQSTIEREAAQLDFDDFVASAELDRDSVTAGATSLRPPTTWAFSTRLEQRFWGDGAIVVTVRQEWIDDVIDRVVIESGGDLFDAVGNIGAGTRRIVKAELTAPFEKLGLSGVQLRAALTFVDSRVTDPITGTRRIISGDRPFEGDLHFTHDLPGGRWSWGFDASFAHREYDFRLDEERLERKGTAIGAFVEFRPRPDLRLRLEAENLTSRRLLDERQQFDQSRALGMLDSIERRQIETAPIFSFSVRKAFGAAAD